MAIMSITITNRPTEEESGVKQLNEAFVDGWGDPENELVSNGLVITLTREDGDEGQDVQQRAVLIRDADPSTREHLNKMLESGEWEEDGEPLKIDKSARLQILRPFGFFVKMYNALNQ